MATLVCFWKVKCSQKVTKTTVFTEGNFNRKCQSHVWFWFWFSHKDCPRDMFTHGLRKFTGFTEGITRSRFHPDAQFSLSHSMASDSTAVVSTVVTKVEGKETCAGPPPYNEWTSMEGKGVYCYKCHNYRTDSWYKLHTHLRCASIPRRSRSS